MNKLIRWPGLVGFIVILAVMASIVLLFLDTWIKLGVTKGLEDVTGAEVNIEVVGHSFFPFGVMLGNIQLTDPENPANNQVQAEVIDAKIELAPLLLQKVIIDELTIVGLAFSQPRASEGKVYREPQGTGTESDTPALGEAADIPSVDEILANSPLKTTQAIEDVQSSYTNHSVQLKTQYEELPSKQKLADYKTRFKDLGDTDYKNPAELAAAKKEFDSLKDELSKDKQKITEFKDAVRLAQADMSPKLTQLKAAPGQDYDQLQAVIAGDSAAIQDVTRMVLGDKAALWSDYLLSAFQIAAPLLKNSAAQEEQKKRAEGEWIEFTDQVPLPDMLIRKAEISLSWQQETINSQWTDITHQHDKTGRPTRYKIDSSSSTLWQSLKLDGNFELLGNAIKAAQDWDLRGIKLQNLSLLDEQKLSTQIDTSILSSKGSLKIKDDLMKGSSDINLRQLAMTAKGSNDLTNLIASTLNGLNQLSINTDIAGPIEDPELSFHSDLNQQLGKALLSNLDPEQQAKLDELKQKLNSKIAGPLGDNNAQLGQWQEWEQLASGDLSSVDEMLKSQFSSALDKQKDKLKDKLKEKLGFD